MEQDLYDEFGNYIGPDLDESDDSEEEQERMEPVREHVDVVQDQSSLMVVDHEINAPNQIIMHEDKKYYPSAEEVYGPGVETLVQEEDTQLLTVPIIAPPKVEKTFAMEKDLPDTSYNKQYSKL